MANPPIVVGELTDVPAPGSPIVSPWAQEVSNRIVHRFANKAALDAGWPAATAGRGALAITLDTLSVYVSGSGNWVLVPQMTSGACALSPNVINVAGLAALTAYRTGAMALVEGFCQLTIPATAETLFTFATAPLGFRPVHNTPGIARYLNAGVSTLQIVPAEITTGGNITGIGPAGPANATYSFSISFIAG